MITGVDFIEAAENGNLEHVKTCLESKIDINFQEDNINASALYSALKKSRYNVALFLLESGADMHCQQEGDWTALHTAAWNNQITMLSTLLHLGINVNLQDELGYTALHYTCHQGQMGAASILLEHGADMTIKNQIGYTPLFVAARFGHKELMELFLNRLADINTQDTEGYTMLHDAARFHGESGEKMVLFLLRNGIDCTIRSKNGDTALDVAKQFRQHYIVELLSSSSQCEKLITR